MSRVRAVNHLILIASILLFLLLATQQSFAQVHQNLIVSFNSDQHTLQVDVQIKTKTPQTDIQFWLNANLKIQTSLKVDVLKKNTTAALYKLTSPEATDSFVLQYKGVIHNPPQDDQSIGTIQPEGVTLLSSAYWYPAPEQELITFEMRVKAPQGWTPVTNARLIQSSDNEYLFSESAPQEDIYLVAAPFAVYQIQKNNLQYQVLLRKEDANLASTYLDLLPQYLEHYIQNIGPYPYSHFSVVENFWETGYGMPGFTLLGSAVIRLPFILTSSLPHEILHSWWGNGVYVDYSLGNWSEGLTTYQADYWQQKKAGSDKSYRLNRLIEFNDFVALNPSKDLPLSSFRGRHDSASQAIGYGKSLMMFQMLEHSLGSFQFNRSLKHFYQKHLHQKASYLDLKNSFEEITRRDLSQFFTQWWEKPGAASIAVLGAVKRTTLMGWTITVTLGQKGDYELQIPIRINGKSREEVKVVTLKNSSQSYVFELKYEPVSLEVDPDFRIFRELYPQERPLTLSNLFAREQITVLTQDSHQEAASLPELWKNRFRGSVQVQTFNSQMPLDPLILLGHDDNILNALAGLTQETEFKVHPDGRVGVDGKTYDLQTHDFVLLLPHPHDPTLPLLWMSSAKGTDFSRWAPRITHYGTYGYLIFDQTKVLVKGSLASGTSPLKYTF